MTTQSTPGATGIEIDWEALGNIATEAYTVGWKNRQSLGGASLVAARAIVAALTDQGFAVVRTEDLKDAEPFITYALESCSRSPLRAGGLRALRAFRAALAAAPVMAEEGNGR